MNGYDPGDGVVDTHDLLTAFPAITRLHPTRAIMTGLSMGGEITTAEIEAYRGDFAGAMPYCGVLAGSDLFNYSLGANVTAAALTGTTITYPTTPAAGTAYTPAYQTAVQSELQGTGDHAQPVDRRADLRHRPDQNRNPVGGYGRAALWRHPAWLPERPRFLELLRVHAPLTKIPFLFGLYPGLNGGTLGFANGSVAGNEGTFYTFSDQPLRMLPQEIALNRAVLRVPVTATSSADPLSQADLPVIHGDPDIPVLSIHGIGDLFVPFSMDQRYDEMMVAHRPGVAVRGPGHPRSHPLRLHDQ